MRSLFPDDRPWPGWQRFLFRFIFVFLITVLDPLYWLYAFIPSNAIMDGGFAWRTAAVEWSNAKFFHIRPVLVPPMGSGDTSFSWALVCLALCFSTLAAIVWSLLDRRRPNYNQLGYWFRTGIRYYLISVAVLYGSIKMTLGQMGTLSLAEMATPVGKLSLMRMCWYFMAASPPYQFFSGLMEMTVALLLLCRRTVTLGLLLGLAVFANVMMLNFSYDIPVKIFSSELVLCCIVLLFRDYERVLGFLVLNKTVPAGRLYEPVSKENWFRWVRYGLKILFIAGVIVIPGWDLLQAKQDAAGQAALPAGVPVGVYQVDRFVVDGDVAGPEPLRGRHWTSLVFDKNGRGCIFGDSALFNYRYGRSGFNYQTDSNASRRLILKGPPGNPGGVPDSLRISYESLSRDSVIYREQIGVDSIYVEAHRTDSIYPLGSWQFHWLSEKVP